MGRTSAAASLGCSPPRYGDTRRLAVVSRGHPEVQVLHQEHHTDHRAGRTVVHQEDQEKGQDGPGRRVQLEEGHLEGGRLEEGKVPGSISKH